LKPTYGRVSRYGLIAFASSLDCIGPLTRTAYDAALTLGVLAGPDPRDSTASQEAVADYVAALSGDIRGLRLGVPRKMLEQGVHESVRGCFYSALDILEARGARLVDIELPHAPLPSRRTTSWPPRRPVRTWRDSTASATASAPKAATI
jgi:aspartyl-tRNA(Asn)/glutamyl-tRNA(Gln) amidotransferase subunit A